MMSGSRSPPRPPSPGGPPASTAGGRVPGGVGTSASRRAPGSTPASGAAHSLVPARPTPPPYGSIPPPPAPQRRSMRLVAAEAAAAASPLAAPAVPSSFAAARPPDLPAAAAGSLPAGPNLPVGLPSVPPSCRRGQSLSALLLLRLVFWLVTPTPVGNLCQFLNRPPPSARPSMLQGPTRTTTAETRTTRYPRSPRLRCRGCGRFTPTRMRCLASCRSLRWAYS